MIPSLLAAALVVDAAASLKGPFGTIAGRFEQAHPGIRVVLQLGGSQELRTQIENGQPVDVVATADSKHMHALVRAGLVSPPWIFARNELAIALPVGNPAGIASLRDLARVQRIILGVPSVPVGHYSEEVLERAESAFGPGFKARVLARVVSRELNVKQVVAKVSLGEADAALVYRTDVAPGIEMIPIPREMNAVAEYPIAIAAHPSTFAREFVDLVLSAEGQSILRASGFLPP